jgi:hypothetical protein
VKRRRAKRRRKWSEEERSDGEELRGKWRRAKRSRVALLKWISSSDSM